MKGIATLLLLLPSEISAAVYFVSPSGSDLNAGTQAAPWRTIGKAAATVSGGDLVYLRGGTYSEYVNISRGGNSDSNRVTFQAYAGEVPIIDGSSRRTNVSNPWNAVDNLINITANYVTLRGIELKNAAAFGIYIRGNYAMIDKIHAHNNYFAGVYFYMSSNGVVSDSVIHDSYDYGPGGTGGGGNADCLGSSASNSPTTIYGYHVFKNNLIYNCSDDGIDTWTSSNNTIEGNIVHHAGYSNASNGGSSSSGQAIGNGNGYKLGPGGGNLVRNNIAYFNLNAGFDDNGGRNITLLNNTAYNTGNAFQLWTSGNSAKNNVAVGGAAIVSGNPVQSHNSWNLGISNPQFASTDPSSPSFLRLAPGSPAIDAGTNVGLPFNGSAPDLGAYETGGLPPPPPLSISLSVGCAPNCPLNGTTTPVNVTVLSGTAASMEFSRDEGSVFLTCPGAAQCYPAPAWGFDWCIDSSCWGGVGGQHSLKVTARSLNGQTATATVSMNVQDAQAAGRTFYVSNSGSDSNPGSATAPWRTIGKAASTLIAGDTAIVLNGTYQEPGVAFRNSGTAANPITLKAQNKRQAVLSSMSGCQSAIDIFGSYVRIEDLRISVSPSNASCGQVIATNAAIHCWESNGPTPANPSTGQVGCHLKGLLVDYSPARQVGIKVRQDFALVEDTEIHNSLEGFNATGIVFRNNIIYGGDLYGDSIYGKGGVRNMRIYNNIVHLNRPGWVRGIFVGGNTGATWMFDRTTGIEAYNSVAFNNVVIEETGANADALGLVGSKDSALFNNVVIGGQLFFGRGGHSPDIQAWPANPAIKNNIISCNGKAALSGWTYTGTLDLDYNNFFDCSGTPAQRHTITGDPLFVDPARDWHLRSGSPAIGSGVVASIAGYGGVTIDVSKDAAEIQRTAPWDLGIYDTGGTPTTPPPPPVGCTLIDLSLAGASSDGGFATLIIRSFGTTADNSSNLTRSTLRLFENGTELGPAHATHADIRNIGQGRFSHWSNMDGSGEALRFSASDNGNPTANGRKYAYCIGTSTASPFDLNADGVANVADVQLAVNQALAVSPCTTGDTNGDGVCDISDVQRVINASLGI